MIKPFTFDWADACWDDPLTGTKVVRLSPPGTDDHFVSEYFRLDCFTPDGESLLMTGRNGRIYTLWSLHLATGEYRKYHSYVGGSTGLTCAAAQHANIAQLVVREGDREEIEKVDLETGNVKRIRPSRDFGQIYDPGVSADGRYVYTTDSDLYIVDAIRREKEGITRAEYNRARYSKPGFWRIYRIDMENGETTEMIGLKAVLGHPNPNPVDASIFEFCCESAHEDGSYDRMNFMNFRTGEYWRGGWQLNTGVNNCNSHEMWSYDGKSMWGHGSFHGYQHISQYDLESRKWKYWLVPIGSGDSAHVHIAPDESFLVGDGKNWGWNTEHEALDKAASGGMDHAFDGVGAHSLGEVIWKFELPEQSLLDSNSVETYQHRDDLVAPIYQNPDKVVKVSPVCKFRSRQRMLNKHMRLESNTHVLPDSNWVIFTSCNENGQHEIWAAQVQK